MGRRCPIWGPRRGKGDHNGVSEICGALYRGGACAWTFDRSTVCSPK